MEWWSRLLEGEAGIDVTKIEPESSSLSDLDGDTRATVEKMMVEQRRKAALEAEGPTAAARWGQAGEERSSKEEALKRFMAQHPEMDFSHANIS